MSPKKPFKKPPVVENRRARFEYYIEDEVEAGIVLVGTEVKSLREGKSNIQDAHAGEKDGDIYLFNMHISEYKGGNRFNHEPTRPRKLLLHKKEIKKFIGQTKVKGMTIVPLSLYFNDNGMVKVKIGLAKGKKLHDKRATEKERDWGREKASIMKNARHD